MEDRHEPEVAGAPEAAAAPEVAPAPAPGAEAPSKAAATAWPRWRRRLGVWAARVLGGWVAATVLLVLVLRFVDPPTTAFIVERRLAAWRADKPLTVRQRWVPLSAISTHLQVAVIAAEDQRFADHLGFDAQAIADAVEDRLDGKQLRGASTLTQQVAKNLFLWPGRSVVRKGLEAYFTVLLELSWSKRRILEVHLNVAEWGNGVFGAEAASRAWFAKSAAQLSPDEAAALAATLPNPRGRRPNAPSPQVQERAVWIADQARRLGPRALDEL